MWLTRYVTDPVTCLKRWFRIWVERYVPPEVAGVIGPCVKAGVVAGVVAGAVAGGAAALLPLPIPLPPAYSPGGGVVLADDLPFQGAPIDFYGPGFGSSLLPLPGSRDYATVGGLALGGFFGGGGGGAYAESRDREHGRRPRHDRGLVVAPGGERVELPPGGDTVVIGGPGNGPADVVDSELPGPALPVDGPVTPPTVVPPVVVPTPNEPTPVPEPASAFLVLAGLVTLFVFRRR